MIASRNAQAANEEDIAEADINDDDIEALKDDTEYEDETTNNEREVSELADVRNSANKLEIGKMLPSAGLKTKAHSGASAAAAKEETKKAAEQKDGVKDFQWGP